jgi:hypothetical protein
MKRITVSVVGLLCLLMLSGLTLAGPQEADDSNAVAVAPNPAPAAPAPAAAPEIVESSQNAEITEESASDAPVGAFQAPKPSQSRARAIRMDKDGFSYGFIDFIDPHSLDQLPVAGVVITFMQNRQIVAQAKSAEDGSFAVQGLSPYAVYSMFVSSDHWICIQGIYIMPEEQDVETTATDRAGRFVFTSLQEREERTTAQSATGDPAVQAIQTIPAGDFLAAIRMGVFGNACGGAGAGCDSCGGACCGGRAGAGGGSGGAGFGAGAAAAAAAAAAAWGAGASNEGGDLATPFQP